MGAPRRDEGDRARVVTLAPRATRADEAPAGSAVDTSRAEEAFETGDGDRRQPGQSRGLVMQAYRDALAFDPALVPALINLGNLHYADGHLPEAAALYEQAIQLAPDAFEGWFNLGHTHHDAGRFAEAVRCYARALELGPSRPMRASTSRWRTRSWGARRTPGRSGSSTSGWRPMANGSRWRANSGNERGPGLRAADGPTGRRLPARAGRRA